MSLRRKLEFIRALVIPVRHRHPDLHETAAAYLRDATASVFKAIWADIKGDNKAAGAWWDDVSFCMSQAEACAQLLDLKGERDDR